MNAQEARKLSENSIKELNEIIDISHDISVVEGMIEAECKKGMFAIINIHKRLPREAVSINRRVIKHFTDIGYKYEFIGGISTLHWSNK